MNISISIYDHTVSVFSSPGGASIALPEYLILAETRQSIMCNQCVIDSTGHSIMKIVQ